MSTVGRPLLSTGDGVCFSGNRKVRDKRDNPRTVAIGRDNVTNVTKLPWTVAIVRDNVTNVTKRTRLLIFSEIFFEFLTKTVRNSMYKCFSE